jgi:hypothetical protein
MDRMTQEEFMRAVREGRVEIPPAFLAAGDRFAEQLRDGVRAMAKAGEAYGRAVVADVERFAVALRAADERLRSSS